MSNWRDSWKAFRADEPGRRFTRRHERMRSASRGAVRRALWIALGGGLVIVGLVFMPLPGPGFVPLGIGLALLAGESRRIASWLDRAEVRVRGWLRRG